MTSFIFIDNFDINLIRYIFLITCTSVKSLYFNIMKNLCQSSFSLVDQERYIRSTMLLPKKIINAIMIKFVYQNCILLFYLYCILLFYLYILSYFIFILSILLKCQRNLNNYFFQLCD